MSIRSAISAIVCGVLLVSPAVGSGAEPAPQPRSLYPRFDLQYLPSVSLQGLVGIRPAAIAAHARGPELGHFTHAMLQMCLEQVMADCNLMAANPPAFAELDQCVFGLNILVTCPNQGEQGRFVAGVCTPCVLRTVNPFDWDGRVRQWFPKATAATHAGRGYFRVPSRLMPESAEPFALFAPDNRTLVCGSESQITDLIERLNDHRPAPVPPPGWSEVERDLVAIAFDNRMLPAVQGEWPKERRGIPEAAVLLQVTQTAALGLSVGERTTVRAVLTAASDAKAEAGAVAIRKLFAMAAEEMVAAKPADPFEALAADAIKNVVIDRRGTRIVMTTSAEGNILKLILGTLRGPD